MASVKTPLLPGPGSSENSSDAPPGARSSRRTKALTYLNEQAKAVQDVMAKNMNLLIEREANLTELEAKADDLERGAQQFGTVTDKVKDRYERQNRKWKIILFGIGGFIIVLTVILLFVIIF